MHSTGSPSAFGLAPVPPEETGSSLCGLPPCVTAGVTAPRGSAPYPALAIKVGTLFRMRVMRREQAWRWKTISRVRVRQAYSLERRFGEGR
jgi:hypothetical protein